MEPTPTIKKILHHLSFAELEAYITAYHGVDDEIVMGDGDPMHDGRKQTNGRIARLVGVDRATVLRWRKQGALSIHQADRAGVGLNVNPSCIWPETWSADIDPQLVLDDMQWEQAQKDRRTQLRTIRKQQRQEQG